MTYQNKDKIPENIGSTWFIYKKGQVVSIIHKLSEYSFWQNGLEFSGKMNLTMQM